MNTCRKLLMISALLLFILIGTTVQDCYDKIYKVKSNSTCKIYSRYNRLCLEYYTTNTYELHCYMITDNMLSDHPEDVHKIDIYTSNINVIPKLFNNFENVETISIQQCNITNIAPNAFSNLTNLVQLNLTENNIDILYKRPFSTINKLNILSLSKNNITVVEDDLLEGLSNLTTLDLDNNKIFDASPIMSNCGNLTGLDLSYNLIEQVEFTSKCSELRRLRLNNNNIQEFNVKLEEASALEHLDLGWNNINSIDAESFQHFVVLSTLSLNNNPLFHDNELPVNLFHNKLELQYLNLSNTGIQDLVVGTFTRLINLLVLDLSRNSLRSLSKGIFHDLRQLKHIYLNNNYLTSFEYDGSNIGLVINLENNLWDCDTLSDIIKSNKLVRISSGSVHNSSNINGINCFENEDKVYQGNGSEKTYESVFNEMRQDFQKIFAQQEGILNASKTFFESLKNDMEQIITNITNTPRKARITENDQGLSNFDHSYGAMVTGIYCIFFVMIAGLILWLLIMFKKYKNSMTVNVNGTGEELRTLTGS